MRFVSQSQQIRAVVRVQDVVEEPADEKAWEADDVEPGDGDRAAGKLGWQAAEVETTTTMV